MKSLPFLDVLVLVVLAVFAQNLHAEGVLSFLSHEFAHKTVQHHSSHQAGGSSAPMGKDDSLFGDPSVLQSRPLCTAQYFRGDGPVINNPKLTAKTKLGCFDNFTVMHSGLTRGPLWSAEHLTRSNIVAAASLQRENSFHPEERLPANERAELSDYARSGFDRGHMAPNKDMPNKLAQWQCFTLANMIPQNPNNNQVLWEGIESAMRTLTKKNGELYLITGPLYSGDNLQSLHGHVLIPTHVFKAVYDPKSGQGAAYLTSNSDGMNYQVISIAELERISGITLFPALSRSAKEVAMSLPKPTPHRKESN